MWKRERQGGNRAASDRERDHLMREHILRKEEA